jgi:hypothetical protein
MTKKVSNETAHFTEKKVSCSQMKPSLNYDNCMETEKAV